MRAHTHILGGNERERGEEASYYNYCCYYYSFVDFNYIASNVHRMHSFLVRTHTIHREYVKSERERERARERERRARDGLVRVCM
jgi:hypothetical protein